MPDYESGGWGFDSSRARHFPYFLLKNMPINAQELLIRALITHFTHTFHPFYPHVGGGFANMAPLVLRVLSLVFFLVGLGNLGWAAGKIRRAAFVIAFHPP